MKKKMLQYDIFIEELGIYIQVCFQCRKYLTVVKFRLRRFFHEICEEGFIPDYT